jgi:radical SAM superfamily enzyme YgiQ (UPF0313 family)
MSRIVFLQNIWFEFMGPMYISAALKSKGHECELYIGNSAAEFLPLLRESKPDLIAFSVMTGMHQWVLETAVALKKEIGCPIILGGPHPTFFPEILEEEGADIICRGEGEAAMVELADALASRADFSVVKNLWVKSNRRIVKNDVRPLIQDLDTIPFADRELYSRYPSLQNNEVQIFISSRGCPYNCTFCFNHQMMELYRGKGRYVRHRSPERVIEEIEQVQTRKAVGRVYFADDTFALSKEWLKGFLPLYGKRIATPFHCLVRINQVDDDLVQLMAENGCRTVFFGIESGNNRIRNEVLKKEITDEEIRRGAAILKSHGIRFRTYNIVGFPGETIEEALETVRLNIEIGTDYPWCSIFMPYPGTRLADYARQQGFLREDNRVDTMESSFHITSLLDNPDKEKLINLHKFFQTAVTLPVLLPLIRQLIRLPANPLFQLWFGFVYFLLYIRSEGRGFWRTFWTAVNNQQFFRKSSA